MIRALKLPDPLLFGLALALTAVGLVMIFDAGYARSLAAGRGPLAPEFRMQFVYLPAAVIASLAAGAIGIDLYRRFAFVFWLASLAALVAVEIAGHAQNGASRWLNFGLVSIQPSEFAKLSTVLYLAAVLADRKAWPTRIRRSRSFVQWLDTVASAKVARLMPGLLVLLSVFLIERGKDLGTAAVVAVIAFAMFAVGGVSRKSLIVGSALAAVLIAAMFLKEPYRMDRLTNHAQRWSGHNVDDIGYQTVQSELGMAAGGIAGVGIGAGRAKHVLPATTTDFVMATVGEELGLIGALGVLGLLGALVWRLFRLALMATSRFSMLILVGIATWFGVQGCVNIMMANGFLPAIGIPLPFVSSGGSSLLALWLAIGLAQSSLRPAASAKPPVSDRAVVATPSQAARISLR